MLRESGGTSGLSGRGRAFWLGAFLFHFFLLVAISARDTLFLLAQGHTSLPSRWEERWTRAHSLVSAGLGETLPRTNPVRQFRLTYVHLAGIEKGYSFFAPAVPNSAKLVFELHHQDGRIEYELPRVSGDAAGMRFTSLLDRIAGTPIESLREVALKMLAYATWQEHSDVDKIRAVFGYVQQPTRAEAKAGKTESYQFLCAYDFTFTRTPHETSPP